MRTSRQSAKRGRERYSAPRAGAMSGRPAPLRQRADRRTAIASRTGFSLLEVILALAIFVGAAAVVGQLWQVATRAALQNELQTEAVVRAESVLNEVLSGVHALTSQADQPFEDDPSWTWAVDVQPLEGSTLYLVRVTVRHEAAAAYGPVEATLSRRHVVPPPDDAEESSEFNLLP
ncbi:MAG: prepilin-type N-terminal cleavage/methylation domain-containing protein [Planctomycetota bacterium]|nr:MAG: prepilin-type N-terminal cleavage/methylation domain-containing protein [Planctomycetota bacterium]